jgi:23S rRNA (adenine2503-C2)-methyltransferase
VPLALQATLPDELARACNIDVSDARRIVSLVHRRGALPDRSPATIRRAALDAARAAGHVPGIELVDRRASSVDPFVKFAFRLPDGAVIETVRIPLEQPGRYSVCVSSQVGCALACAFCATGRMGLARNLEVWEIVEQVRRVRIDLEENPPSLPGSLPGGLGAQPGMPGEDTKRTTAGLGAQPGMPGEGTKRTTAGLGAQPGMPTEDTKHTARARVHGVLFQGMGEPLANAERVIAAVRVMSEPSALAIDMRNITVCTSGLPSGIRMLLREVPAVRLGLSIGSARSGERRAIMPIDSAHPLAEVLAAAGEHARATRMAPMFAYTLLAGVNDGDEDANALADLARAFAEAHGVRPRLSLIPYNSIAKEGAADPFGPSGRLAAFREALGARGVGSIVRYSGGGDVGAACGQLARPPVRSPRRRLTVDPDPTPR